MRIGIDARFYGPSVGTGIGRYTERLLHELAELDRSNEYVVFLRDENFDLFRPRSARFHKVRAPWRWYSLAEQVRFPVLLRSQRLDLIHFPHFNVPLFSPTPFVVTVHDMILHKFPTERASTLEPAFYWLKHTAYKLVICQAIRRASHIIAVTKNTEKDIVETYGVSPAKLTVTYEACDPPVVASTAKVDLRARFGITDPFVMYVGNAYPHKNIERLIDAVLQLRSAGEQFQLVVVGRNDFFSRRLQARTASMPSAVQSAIIFTGYVDDAVLDQIYRQATLYAFPSLYEGFGLPGLEAMSRGVPVAAARASSLPEVYGDAAAYFQPEDTNDIAAVIRRLLHDKQQRESLRQRGLDRVGQYSWRRMAEQTLAVYTHSGGPGVHHGN